MPIPIFIRFAAKPKRLAGRHQSRFPSKRHLRIELLENRRLLAADWQQFGRDIDGENENDQSGYSISLSSDGRTVAIGAPINNGGGNAAGHTRIFRLTPGSYIWRQVGSDIDGEADDDQSGDAIALSADGNTVAIGAPINSGTGSESGHTRVFRFDSSTEDWNQIGDDLDGEESFDQSGYSVAISDDGNTVAVGAPYNSGNGEESGHTRIFRFDANTTAWSQLGSDIDGEASFDQSGYSIALNGDGNIVGIGAPKNSDKEIDAGHTRVLQFDADSGSWNQLGADIDGEVSEDYSGDSVSLSADGQIVAIGAPYNDGNGDDSGHVRIFQLDSDTQSWNQLGTDIDGESSGDQSGWSVAVTGDGESVAIGAPENSKNGTAAGHGRVFRFDHDALAWQQVGTDVDSEDAWDFFGDSIAIGDDGKTVAMGAPNNSGSGIDSGHTRIFRLVGDFWRNPRNHLDVNNDGFASPIDALYVINDLNVNGSRELPDPPVPPNAPPPYLDPTGDNVVSPLDALTIINSLSSAGGGEGEAASYFVNSDTPHFPPQFVTQTGANSRNILQVLPEVPTQASNSHQDISRFESAEVGLAMSDNVSATRECAIAECKFWYSSSPDSKLDDLVDAVTDQSEFNPADSWFQLWFADGRSL